MVNVPWIDVEGIIKETNYLLITGNHLALGKQRTKATICDDFPTATFLGGENSKMVVQWSPRIPGPSFCGQFAFSALFASSWSPAQAQGEDWSSLGGIRSNKLYGQKHICWWIYCRKSIRIVITAITIAMMIIYKYSNMNIWEVTTVMNDDHSVAFLHPIFQFPTRLLAKFVAFRLEEPRGNG